ncbi:hypothetical protein BGX24_012641 [Mortierella sp. AD032]|nr:hypothetical protein BGX24_012641 [Mortierella sp. AD032]
MASFERQHITVLPWPAKFPDLNLTQLDQHPEVPKDENELWGSVQVIWEYLPKEILEKLYESMPESLAEVIRMIPCICLTAIETVRRIH